MLSLIYTKFEEKFKNLVHSFDTENLDKLKFFFQRDTNSTLWRKAKRSESLMEVIRMRCIAILFLIGRAKRFSN